MERRSESLLESEVIAEVSRARNLFTGVLRVFSCFIAKATLGGCHLDILGIHSS